MFRLTNEELAEIGVDKVEAVQTAFDSFREYVDMQKDELVADLMRQYSLDEDTVRKLELG